MKGMEAGMKSYKFIILLLTLTLVFNMLCVSNVFAYGNPGMTTGTDINIILDGTPIQFGDETNDPKPYIKDGRTLVPFRKIFEIIGMEVFWNSLNQTVTARNESIDMEIYIGNKTARVNGREIGLDVAAEITEGRTFVPLRFVSENCGITVYWDSASRTVILTNTNAQTPTVLPKATPTKVILPKITTISTELIESTPTPEPYTATPEPIPTKAPNQTGVETEDSENYFSDTEVLLKSPSDDKSVENEEIIANDDSKEIVLLDIAGVDEDYQADAITVAKYLNNAIRKSDREFDFERALQLVEEAPDMELEESLDENITQNNINADMAVDKLQELVSTRLGLTFTSELRSQIHEVVNSTFNSRYTVWEDDDGIGDLKWTKEKREKGEGSYFKMYFAIKNKDTEDVLYIIPINLYITASKYKVSKYFGLKKDTKYSSNINVQALKISKFLNAGIVKNKAKQYSFGETGYLNHIFINQGAYFKNPERISMEHSCPDDGLSYRLDYIDTTGKVVRSEIRKNESGKTIIFYPTKSYTDSNGETDAPLPAGSYKLKLVNIEPSYKISLKEGLVSYYP